MPANKSTLLFFVYLAATVLIHPMMHAQIYTGEIQVTAALTDQVGIGIESPGSKLEVNGDIALGRAFKIKFLETAGGAERAYIRTTNGENGENHNSMIMAVGQGLEAVYIKHTGQVGIGNFNPSEKLEVSGNIKASGSISSANMFTNSFVTSGSITTNQAVINSTSPLFKLDNPKTILNEGDIIGEIQFYQNDASSGGTGIAGSIKAISRDRPGAGTFYGNISRLGFFIGNTNNGLGTPTEAMTISQPGWVGIGVQNPQHPLHVSGTIRATTYIADSGNPWPDYVFGKNYDLPSLSETQYFIEKNKHLPGIPSAKEVEANGVDLSEMNRKLLEKIEELTLYIIEQNERITTLEKKVNEKE